MTSQAMLTALLEYSRLDSRKGALEQVDCNDLWASAVRRLSDMIQESEADIAYGNLPVIHGYRSQLSLLFYHLLSNALVYRKKGSVAQVKLEVSELESHWHFLLKDNGTGIAANNAEKIFKVLQRCTTDSDYPGIGMGLAVAKKVVFHHSGELWLASSSDTDGSEFCFTLEKDLVR